MSTAYLFAVVVTLAGLFVSGYASAGNAELVNNIFLYWQFPLWCAAVFAFFAAMLFTVYLNVLGRREIEAGIVAEATYKVSVLVQLAVALARDSKNTPAVARLSRSSVAPDVIVVVFEWTSGEAQLRVDWPVPVECFYLPELPPVEPGDTLTLMSRSAVYETLELCLGTGFPPPTVK